MGQGTDQFDVLPEFWEDPKHGSTLGFYNLHHRSIGVRIGGSIFGSQGFGLAPSDRPGVPKMSYDRRFGRFKW